MHARLKIQVSKLIYNKEDSEQTLFNLIRPKEADATQTSKATFYFRNCRVGSSIVSHLKLRHANKGTERPEYPCQPTENVGSLRQGVLLSTCLSRFAALASEVAANCSFFLLFVYVVRWTGTFGGLNSVPPSDLVFPRGSCSHPSFTVLPTSS